MAQSVADCAAVPRAPGGLLVRPVMYADEWCEALLVRVALANGLSPGSPVVMRDVLEATGNYSRTAQASLAYLRDPPTLKSAEPLFDALVPAWALSGGSRKTGLKVCWSCLAERGYFSAWWRLRGYHLCLRHSMHLDDLPVAVGANTQMVRLLRSPDLRERAENFALTRPAPSTLAVSVARTLWSTVWHESPTKNPLGLACAVLLAELLRALMKARRGRDGTAWSLGEAELGALWLREHGSMPNGSESGVNQFLDELWMPIHRAAACRVLERVKRAEAVVRTSMSELPLAHWIAHLTSRSSRLYGRGAGGGVPAAAHRPDVVLMTTLAAELNVTRKTLWRAIRNCRVAPVAVVGRSRRFRLISRDDVPQLRGHLAEYLRTDEAMGLLSIAGRRLIMRQLRLAGMIKCVGTGRNMLCYRGSVADLLEALKVQVDSVRLVPCSHLLALDDGAIYHRRDMRVIREFYEDLQAGRVPLYCTGRGHGIAAFAVPIEVLTRLARRTLAWTSRVRRDPRQLELQLC